MNIVAQDQSYRLIHVVRDGIAPMHKEEWRLQTWNGQDWSGKTMMFYDMAEAVNAASKFGLTVQDEHTG